MPMKRDEKGGGTNADGTQSTMYCSHCYRNGQFVLPDISVVEMQARVRDKIIELAAIGDNRAVAPLSDILGGRNPVVRER